jgi:uncharacterized protein (DUF1778 family)
MPNKVLREKIHNASVRTRVPQELKRRWQGAAALRGQTLTDFIIGAANKEAGTVFDQEERIAISMEGQKKLAKMLLNPPELPDAMKNLLKKYLLPGNSYDTENRSV